MPLRLAALALVLWLALAWTKQTACGCGTLEALERKIEFNFKDASFENIGDKLGSAMETLNQAAAACDSRGSSAMCHSACWLAGDRGKIQRLMWWECLMGGGLKRRLEDKQHASGMGRARSGHGSGANVYGGRSGSAGSAHDHEEL